MADVEEPERSETGDREGKARIGVAFNREYFFSPRGILKIVEFFLLLIGFAACGSFKSGYNRHFVVSMGKADFFLFVSVVGWLFVIIVFFVNISGLIHKFEHRLRDIITSIIHANIALFLLISAAMMADEAVRLARLSGACDFIKKYTDTTCAAYDTAVAFGLFAMVAFVVDAVLYFFEWKKHYTQ